ncbi:PIN domain-containing protein [Psychromonas arctica]|uniref:PIN domain-containing protein n=1 Tax=Psychromonas arctica TaxID=168275 RepID=A0ABU9HC98_9GAMM
MIKYLVLDTNILHKDYDFRSKDLRKLIKLCSLYNVRVCIPQVVIDECLGQYDKEFSKALTGLKNAKKDVNRILNDKYINRFPFEEFINGISQRKSIYSGVLKEFIKEKSIDILPYCQVPHQEVVKRMYNSEYPFIGKDMERGYKDYLLTTSVLEYINEERAVIYTKNVKDFSDNINDNSLNVLHSDYLSDNCFVSGNLPLIINKLHETHKAFQTLHLDSSDLDVFLEKMVSNILESILYQDELYGGMWFKPTISEETVYSQLEGEPTIEQDLEWKAFTVSGKIKIQFNCKFSLNNYEFEMLDNSFFFYDLVSDAIRKKGHSSDEEWQYVFYDVRYISIFEFTYDLFEFDKNPLDTFDEYALTVYRIN